MKEIGQKVPKNVSLVVHGTHPAGDELMRKAIACGVTKININRGVRDPYTAFMAENMGKMDITELQVEAVDVFATACERIMGVFGCLGKA